MAKLIDIYEFIIERQVLFSLFVSDIELQFSCLYLIDIIRRAFFKFFISIYMYVTREICNDF